MQSRLWRILVFIFDFLGSLLHLQIVLPKYRQKNIFVRFNKVIYTSSYASALREALIKNSFAHRIFPVSCKIKKDPYFWASICFLIFLVSINDLVKIF